MMIRARIYINVFCDTSKFKRLKRRKLEGVAKWSRDARRCRKGWDVCRQSSAKSPCAVIVWC